MGFLRSLVRGLSTDMGMRVPSTERSDVARLFFEAVRGCHPVPFFETGEVVQAQSEAAMESEWPDHRHGHLPLF
jgi:hypothetical protein